MRYRTTSTPLGQVLLVGSDGHLTGLYVEHPELPAPADDWIEDDGTLDAAERQLQEYFAGTRTDFELAVQLQGTPFQLAVWGELQRIPHGRTVGYGELARRLGAPRAARAVGAACGSNPVSIVVPCHRVVGADGSLTGYGWGVERKAWLLRHERGQVALTA